jgi:repressor LexA
MAKKSVSELPDGPADANGLTPRQLKILSVIKKAVEDQGYPPTMREIGQAAGLSSTASVTYQLQILEEKGWIRRDAARGRAIEITLPGQDGEAAPQDKTRLIPLVGRIAAGNPIWPSKRSKRYYHCQNQLLVKVIFSYFRLKVIP